MHVRIVACEFVDDNMKERLCVCVLIYGTDVVSVYAMVVDIFLLIRRYLEVFIVHVLIGMRVDVVCYRVCLYLCRTS